MVELSLLPVVEQLVGSKLGLQNVEERAQHHRFGKSFGARRSISGASAPGTIRRCAPIRAAAGGGGVGAELSFTCGPLRPLPSSPFGLRAPGEGRDWRRDASRNRRGASSAQS